MRELDPDIHLHLTRYLSGGSSAREVAEIESRLAASPELQHELDALRWLWEASAGLPPADRVDEMWGEVARQLAEREARRLSVAGSKRQAATPVFTLERSSRRRGMWRRWALGVGAAASLAAVGYSVSVGYSDHGNATPPVADAAHEYRTARGQRGVVQLGDGSRIELGVASVLRVHPFAEGHQKVELVEGEAAFTVPHDPARTFVVRSRNAIVEDLGTRFGVRAYRDDPRVRVVVTEGEVALRADAYPGDTAAVLLPGDVGEVDREGRTNVRRDSMAGAYLAWTGGRFHFDNASLADVVADLERWYDVTIELETPALATRRVTLSMPAGSLTEALDAITAPIGLVHVRRGAAAVLLRSK